MRLTKQAKSDAGYMLRCGSVWKYYDMSAAAKVLRSIPSDKRSEQSRVNGKLGGRPKGSKNKEARHG